MEKKLSGISQPHAKGRGKSALLKEIGHSSFPLNSFSLTISRIKGDVDPSLLDGVQAVLQPISTKFVLGLEVGIRAFNMHIQGEISLLMPKTDIYVRELKAIIKQVLPMRGRGFKIQIKPFSVGQTDVFFDDRLLHKGPGQRTLSSKSTQCLPFGMKLPLLHMCARI